MIIDQFTSDADGEVPELLEDAQTLEDVFQRFKPSVEVDFTDEDGSTVTETLRFNEIKDFEANGGKGKLVSNSPFLSGLKDEMDNAAKIRKQIEQNKRLREMLKNPESREELKQYLQQMLDELRDNE